MSVLKTEPALVATAVNALLLCAAGFGTNLSTDQIVLIMAVVNAVLAVFVRQVVTPVASD